MRQLKYLNKYLYKYKWHLLLGTFFVILSNIFQIIPAWLVRDSIDLVTDNITLYQTLDNTNIQNSFFSVFAFGVLVYAGWILIMALLRGIFLYFVRQTLIVMSRLIEYD